MEIDELLKLGVKADEDAIRLQHLSAELHADDAQRVVASITELLATSDEMRLLAFLPQQEPPE